MAMQLIAHSEMYTYIYIYKHCIYSKCVLTFSIYSYRFLSSYELKLFEFMKSSIIARYIYTCTSGLCFVTDIELLIILCDH